MFIENVLYKTFMYKICTKSVWLKSADSSLESRDLIPVSAMKSTKMFST